MKKLLVIIAILLCFSLIVTMLATGKAPDDESETKTDFETEPDEDRTVIGFTIDQTHYRCVKGSTWRQLLEESLVIPHGICEKDGFVGTGNEGKYLLLLMPDGHGIFPRIDDPIVAGGNYVEIEGPVFEDGIGVFYLNSEPISFPIGYSWRDFVNAGFYEEFTLEVHYNAVGYRVSEDDLRFITFNGDIFDSSSLIVDGEKYALSEDSIS